MHTQILYYKHSMPSTTVGHLHEIPSNSVSYTYGSSSKPPVLYPM